MIIVDITPEMTISAKRKADEMGELRNSIRKGQGNLTGFLGEECFIKSFDQSKIVNGYDYDLRIGNYTVEIKTKDRTVPPKSNFECSIANHNTKQETDFYVFVSLLRQRNVFVKGYLLGFIDKNEYFQKATFRQKGDVDPSNGWQVKTDCWNLPISKLQTFPRK